MKNEWQEAIIDALVIRHIYKYEHENNPRKALNDILNWEVMVALDPLVSSEAQALYQLGIQKGLDMSRWA
jgi:hypothetical protein